jgi:glucosamine-6-phosphate deaminase
MGTPVAKENVGRLGLDTEIKNQPELAREELATIAKRIALAPPIKPLSRAVTPELYPDSMASRIPAFASHPNALTPEDLSFDRMESRIGSGSIAV